LPVENQICLARDAEKFLDKRTVIFLEIDVEIPTSNEWQYLLKNEAVLSGNMSGKSCVNSFGKISH
jgi:hypothetical protein